MTPFSYNEAIGHLTEVEKNRFVACYFALADPNTAVSRHLTVTWMTKLTLLKINYEQAAKDFGSASIESFKKMISTTFKKIEKLAESGDLSAPAVPKTPKKATPAKSRKRKANDDDDYADTTPSAKQSAAKKLRARKVKDEKVVSDGEHAST